MDDDIIDVMMDNFMARPDTEHDPAFMPEVPMTGDGVVIIMDTGERLHGSVSKCSRLIYEDNEFAGYFIDVYTDDGRDIYTRTDPDIRRAYRYRTGEGADRVSGNVAGVEIDNQ